MMLPNSDREEVFKCLAESGFYCSLHVRPERVGDSVKTMKYIQHKGTGLYITEPFHERSWREVACQLLAKTWAMFPEWRDFVDRAQHALFFL